MASVNSQPRMGRARDALGRELVDQSGALISTTAIDISDYSRETGTEAFEEDHCPFISTFLEGWKAPNAE